MGGWSVPGYTGLKTIGSGGFGDVVLAKHDPSGTLVAIKYLRPELLGDPEFAEMFRREAQVLASLDDQNVVRLYEYVESPSGAAIVMELVGGVSLREILTYQGKTTAEAALAVLRGSLLGLAAAHRRGVVHRDYKPENVLVNGDGVSKLTDFGIAARTGEHTVPAGTVNYAAPEQIAGAPATPASDIYAATVTFYECLTGHPPVTGRTAEQPARDSAEPVAQAAVPDELRPLVAAGLADEPGGRPTDALSFVSELSAAAAKAYGRDWAERGRSHLSEAALLLSALWPSGPPPAANGSAAYRIPLRRRLRIRHAGGLHAAVAAGAVVVTAAAVGTALAAPGPQRPAANAQPLPAVRTVQLQLSSDGASSSGASSKAGISTHGHPSPRPDNSPSGSHPSSTGHQGSTGNPVGTGNTVGPGNTMITNPPPVVTSPPSPPHTTSPPPVAPEVPVITGASTYTEGVYVYFSVTYSDPGNDAEGFGFVGVDGSGWAEETHPFSSPSYGIVGADSIAYPFNSGCGTPQQISSYVQVWIYDTAGAQSDPVTLHLVCSGV